MKRVRPIVATTVVTLLVQFLISYKLWIPSERDFPLVSAFPFLSLSFGLIGDIIVMGVLVAALALLLVWPANRYIIAIVIASSGLLVLEDIARLQPWLYIDWMILLAVALYANPRGKGSERVTSNQEMSEQVTSDQVQNNQRTWRIGEEKVIATTTILLAGTYFWSGIQKCNVAFTFEFAPWLASAVGLGSFIAEHHNLAYILATIEVLTGVALMFPKSMHWGRNAAIAMHLFLLVALGPFGHNWNAVIWPWNLQMIALLLIIVPPRADRSALVALPEAIRLFRWSPLFITLILLLLLLPGLNYFRLWDSHLSGSLYSANNLEAIFYYNASDERNLPPSSARLRFIDTTNGERFIMLDHWAMDELEAPWYPEERYFKRLGARLCDCICDTAHAGVTLTIKKKFTSEQYLVRYPCGELMRGR